MAGHSKFHNIKHRKERQDSKRAKVFTKIGKILTIAARNGTDPKMNPSLRTALEAARRANMPKDNIKNAINKAADKNADIEVKYTGYGPGKIAFLIEGITDNSNRTFTELKVLFNKYGSGLNDLSFMFEHIALANIKSTNDEKVSEDDVLELLADFDIDDIYEDDGINVIANFSDLFNIQNALESKFSEIICESAYKTTSKIDAEDIEKVKNFIDIMEDHDDVQNVWHNCSNI
ncbi:YebC/PmpR family DNA-binding transcriptional regulator [Candidatus Cytomitobacter indipagum]|uniref:Probable transcriptional regulatory protein FZC35_02465 n=1 Tax=Candidatus Cytomitobacter indipagum TaxID=2601575 RepID=A0A5C0UER9_9PROT|nr:YebC/PmpR family DNA-binding transcriptional regulator [Candidatus Cytomitobacter indipagum]QEK38217.1 YebC/PmpR family DNA-binding transcriptional regulator [Candidatus Cytomitobacter indipagum]